MILFLFVQFTLAFDFSDPGIDIQSLVDRGLVGFELCLQLIVADERIVCSLDFVFRFVEKLDDLVTHNRRLA